MRTLLLLTLISSAEYQDVWRLGVSDNKADEFSMESHVRETLTPQSAEIIDDHYFFKGGYDQVGTLAQDEPLKNFERALKLSDPEVFIHFPLDEIQQEYRLELDFVWGNHLSGGQDWEHILKVSINGHEIGTTPAYKLAATFYLAVPPAVLKKGANVVSIERIADQQEAYSSIDTFALQSATRHVPDQDGDGASDAWEILAGTDEHRHDITPPPLKGLIGINFISGEHPLEGAWRHAEMNGFIPQINWNQMGPMRQWHNQERNEQRFDTKAISGPRFGQIVDASGEIRPAMSIHTTQSRCTTSHNNLGAPASKLLNGFLGTDDHYPTKIEIDHVPYPSYDLYVYVSTDHTDPEIKISVPGAEPQLCSPLGSTPTVDFLPITQTKHPKAPFANVLKFSALTHKNLAIVAERGNKKTVGVAAIQIVDREADADGDHLPDWYELQHGLPFYNPQDGKQDPDRDGLTNLQEYAALTHPLRADSDGDGLSDLVETHTGTYQSTQDSGTHPLRADTDGDGLSDGAELSHYAPSNPLMPDTDGDGRSDKQELKTHTCPTSKAPFGVPLVDAGKRLLWDFPQVQFLWDHGKLSSDDWRDKSLFHVSCLNEAEKNNGWGSFQIFLHHNNQNEIHIGCFSHSLSGFLQEGGNKEIWLSQQVESPLKALGLTGSGMRDISDPFSMRLEIIKNTETAKWDLTLSVHNLATQQEISRIEKSGLVPAPSILEGHAQWKDYEGLPYALHEHPGVQLLQTDRNLKHDLSNEMPQIPDLDSLLSDRPSIRDASRFLKFATFGPTPASILELEQNGAAKWIDDQIKHPPTYLSTYINDIHEDFYGEQLRIDQYGYNANNNTILTDNIKTGVAQAAVLSDDQLRQRVAYALSQLLVVSRKDDSINRSVRGLADYYDIFVEHAFGNYKDILREVTYHPCMGAYLTSAGSAKANPEKNQFPDENYARELMQLFTCGLWELQPNGEPRLDQAGKQIPTYTNDEITECARVFTGLWFAGNRWKGGGWQDNHYRNPMQIHPDQHDFLEKKVIGGHTIPARVPSLANAQQDIDDLLTIVFDAPSTAPYVSRYLIQQLVTDNPSPDYIQRVSDVFCDNGNGLRGDMTALIKAILLDQEALSGNRKSGKLTEPFLRYMHAMRLLNYADYDHLEWWDYGDFNRKTSQEPLKASSVFNFYSADYDGTAALRQNGLVSPVFHITNDYTSVAFPNLLWELIEHGIRYHSHYSFASDYRDLLAIGDDTEKLLKYVDLLCCGGRMTDTTRRIILETVSALDPHDLKGKIKLILYIGLTSPEGAIQN